MYTITHSFSRSLPLKNKKNLRQLYSSLKQDIFLQGIAHCLSTIIINISLVSLMDYSVCFQVLSLYLRDDGHEFFPSPPSQHSCTELSTRLQYSSLLLISTDASYESPILCPFRFLPTGATANDCFSGMYGITLSVPQPITDDVFQVVVTS